MNKKYNVLYIRNENNKKEHRTPIIPKDVSKLLSVGYTVYIESSNHRIYSDDDYHANGAIITKGKWYIPKFQDALIIGLKDVMELDNLCNHHHMYFAHCYKKQTGYREILNTFASSSSIIYDFEYFINNNGKRIISFGFFAGVAGCLLALLQYINKKLFNKNISNINYWNSTIEVILYIFDNLYLFNNINISIIGAQGNCGLGVQSILQKLNLNYNIIDKYTDATTFDNVDILYNCILLDNNYNEVWFDANTSYSKSIIIADISCDYSKPNNPIQIYNTNTTWENPVYSYNKYVDIVAINNLPSLIPKESSNYFSSKCVNLLLEVDDQTMSCWKNTEKAFFSKITEF